MLTVDRPIEADFDWIISDSDTEGMGYVLFNNEIYILPLFYFLFLFFYQFSETCLLSEDLFDCEKIDIGLEECC